MENDPTIPIDDPDGPVNEVKEATEVYEGPEDSTEQARLESILADVEQGWRISIYRLSPTWCRGLLETIDIHEPDFRIDINDLIRRWGGQRLHVKIINHKNKIMGGGTISLFSYPPLRCGEPITDVDVSQLPRRAWNLNPYWDPANVNQMPPPQAPAPAPAPAQPSVDLTKLLEMVNQGRGSDLELALRLMDRQAKNAPAPLPPTDPTGMMTQMMGMVKMFKSMQDLFGGTAGGGDQAAPAGDPDSIMPMLTQLVQGLMGARNQSPPVSDRPAVVPPRRPPPQQLSGAVQPPPPPQRPAPPAGEPAPAPPPAAADEGDHLGQIADKLAGLNPEDAADVVMEALGNMPQEKRERALSAFMMSMQEDSDLDGSLNPFDTYSQHDELDRPADKSHSDPVPNPRGVKP